MEEQNNKITKIKDEENKDKVEEENRTGDNQTYLELAMKYPSPKEIANWILETVKNFNWNDQQKEVFKTAMNEVNKIFMESKWDETELAKVRFRLYAINNWIDKKNDSKDTIDNTDTQQNTQWENKPDQSNIENSDIQKQEANWEWISMDQMTAKKIAISDAVKNLWGNGSIPYKIIEDKMFKLSDGNYKSKIKIQKL